MAKTTDDEAKKPVSRGQKTAAWLMTGMLILGLGGFGVTNFGGNVSSIGSVGDITLSVDDYARAVRQEVAAFSAQLGSQVPVSEAIGFGLDRKALQGLVTRAALDDAALKMGLSVGDQTVAAEVLKISAFQGTSGTFDRAAYRHASAGGRTVMEAEPGGRAAEDVRALYAWTCRQIGLPTPRPKRKARS